MELSRSFNRSKLAGLGLSLLFSSTALSLNFQVPGISIFLVSISMLIGLLGAKGRFSWFSMITIFFVLIAFFMSLLLADPDSSAFNNYLGSFLLYGICGLIYARLNIDYKFFYKCVVFFGLISAALLLKILFQGYLPSSVGVDDVSGFYMTVSHAITFITLAAFYNYYSCRDAFVKYISLLLFLLNFAFLFVFGARSVFLAALLFLTTFYIKANGAMNARYLFLASLAFILLYFFSDDIVSGIDMIMASFELESRSLSRIVEYSVKDGDASSGRYAIWNHALDGIINSPILGNGVASFEGRYGYYVHNIFLQVIYDGGLVLLIPLIYLFSKFALIFFSKKTQLDDWVFIMMIFFGGIFVLFFSSTIWRSMYFWFFLGWVFEYRIAAISRFR